MPTTRIVWGPNSPVIRTVSPMCLCSAFTVAGASATGATGRILQDNDLNAANTFTDPNRVVPKPLKVAAQGSTVTVELPPLSVATLQVNLT